MSHKCIFGHQESATYTIHNTHLSPVYIGKETCNNTYLNSYKFDEC